MRKRGSIGTLLLLMYLAGVGLFTGPSLAQLLIGRLPQPRLELIPFADMISVLTDKNTVGLGAFVNIAGNIALLFPLGLFLPLFWRWFERAGRTIRWCFGTSLSIERYSWPRAASPRQMICCSIRSAARSASRQQGF